MDYAKARKSLSAVEKKLRQCPGCPYLLVKRAILIQLQDEDADTPPLKEAERSLVKAHRSDPNHLEAIEELAHFYDAITDRPKLARKFAALYIEKSTPVLESMKVIVREASMLARRRPIRPRPPTK